MNFKKSILSLTVGVASLFLGFGSSAFAQSAPEPSPSPTPIVTPPPEKPVEKVVELPNLLDALASYSENQLSTLIKLSDQVGALPDLKKLIETEQVTVLAPKNFAFALLSEVRPDRKDFEQKVEAKMEELRNNPEYTKNLILNHVFLGKLDFKTLKNGQKLKSINGNMVTVLKAKKTVSFVSRSGQISTVITPNIMTKQGVVHVINKVVLPNKAKMPKTVVTPQKPVEQPVQQTPVVTPTP
jgi:uncharacterized surface protein with fasciclin (FAS1) repeats